MKLSSSIKIVPKSAIFCAIFILLLHSFIAHNHQGNSTKEQLYSVTDNFDLLNFISFFITIDIGENHLTNFNFELNETEEKVEFINKIFFLIPSIYTKTYLISNTFFINESFSSGIFIVDIPNQFLFRGPPVFC